MNDKVLILKKEMGCLTRKLAKQILLFCGVLTISLTDSMAQTHSSVFEQKVVTNVIQMLKSNNDSAIVNFVNTFLEQEPGKGKNMWVQRIKNIRMDLRGLMDDIAVDTTHDGICMFFSGAGVEKQLKIVFQPETDSISDLFVTMPQERLQISVENVAQTFEQLEKEGWAGVVYVNVEGEVILKRAFGFANTELGIHNELNTIFGIGSRPIDFTVAAICLLAQNGQLSFSDKISEYFEDVPNDKSAMTIKHLLTGQSGLPDFFDKPADWDPDLAWVDRETAVKRLLSQKLLFEPGTDQQHSHGAFGLLAALVEKVSNEPYYKYINNHFFVPAQMQRTGENGDKKGFTLSDFAVGYGYKSVGIPNIPPNWGPTSWLVKGSGGMFSTLDDLLGFYRLIRSNKVLDTTHNVTFRQSSVSVDGSERGFELFSAYQPPNTEIFLFLNKIPERNRMQQVFRALESLVE